MIRNLRTAIIFILIVVVILLILQGLFFLNKIEDFSSTALSNIYNLVNIIVPPITLIAVFLTFQNQQQQLRETRRQMSLAQNNIWHNEQNLQIQRIEDRFFVFLSIHRENVASMTFRGEVIGKRFFIEAFDKFQKVYQISIEVNEYLIRKNLVKKLSEIDLIELSYKVIFFGCTGSNSLRVLSSSLISFDKYVIHPDKEMNFVSIFIHELTIKGVNEQGLQSNLGNYFRHLFHTVTYINDLQVLQDTDKQFYIKRLRGQFSNHEIAMLFVNCFSIGKRWTAYSHDNSKDTEDLITKYELIRNLPSDFFNDFDFRCYFPDIHYEGHLYIFRDDPAYRKC